MSIAARGTYAVAVGEKTLRGRTLRELRDEDHGGPDAWMNERIHIILTRAPRIRAGLALPTRSTGP